MLDLNNLGKYREGNRLEARQALGGLPESLWETYSAFANAEGGVILLGVEEYKDRSLHPIDLPDPMALVQEFLALLPAKASINLLTEDSIVWLEMDGKDVVAIEIPKAQPDQQPVYIGQDPFTGTYYRRGDGDFRCSREEVRAMLDRAARFHAGA